MNTEVPLTSKAQIERYTNQVLEKAQELLWGGSETENIEAHNLIAKLIQDRRTAGI